MPPNGTNVVHSKQWHNTAQRAQDGTQWHKRHNNSTDKAGSKCLAELCAGLSFTDNGGLLEHVLIKASTTHLMLTGTHTTGTRHQYPFQLW
jgi:hypothetical protein